MLEEYTAMIKRIIGMAIVGFMPLYAITLDGLVSEAMKHSTIIKKSKAQIELSRAQRKQSKADQFGSIDLVGSYTHYNIPRTLAPMTPSTLSSGQPVTATKDLYSAGVTYTVPLFTGFAQTRQVEMDRIAEQMAKSKLSLTKSQLAYNIASLYLSALSLQDMKRAQQKHVYALEKLRKRIEDEVSVGRKAQIDLLKAESDLYGNRAYLEVIDGNIEMTKATLASLAGIPEVKYLHPVKVRVKKPRYSIKSLMRKADRLNRVKVAEYGVKKAQKGVEKSQAAYMPQVALNSYYGRNYGQNPADDWENEELWQVGVNAKWTLYDFGKRSNQGQKAKIAKMQATFDKQQVLLDLKKSLIEAKAKISQAYATYQGNLKQFALAQKSEKIERVRYENGVSTINDLLYATSQTQLARAKLIESKYNYQKGKFYMDYLLEKGIASARK